jgi:hypothetical protein
VSLAISAPRFAPGFSDRTRTAKTDFQILLTRYALVVAIFDTRHQRVRYMRSCQHLTLRIGERSERNV